MKEPRKAALSFIFITLFLDILGIGLIIPITPRLVGTFVSDPSAQSRTYGAFIALYAVMQFLFSPILGALSDKVGRRPVILGSLAGAGIDYLVMAMAPTLGLLFLGRLVSGITGASLTAATAYIADVSPPEKRAQNFGIIGIAFGLGFVAGPALGGIVGDFGQKMGLGLRLPFFVAAGLSLVNAAYGAFVLPESLSLANRKAFSLSRANAFSAIVALKRYPVVLGLAASLCLRNLAEFSLHAVWVLFTAYKFHWGIRETGISLALVGIVAAVVQGGLIRPIVRTIGERRAVLVGYGIAAFAYALYGVAAAGWMMYAIIVVTGFGGIAGPTTQAIISRQIPANEQGAVQGALTSLSSLMGILAPALATTLFGYFISPRAPVHLPGAPFFSSALLTLAALAMAARSLTKNPPPPLIPSPASEPESGVDDAAPNPDVPLT